MSDRITILVGTMTGTAEMVAEEVKEALEAQGLEAEILLMDGLGVDCLAGGGVFLICSSTYGQGDVPDNAQAFAAELEAERPDLSSVAYGVIALGDKTYNQTYCMGGLTFDRLFAELGASRIGEALTHDASSGELAEDAAVAWAAHWGELVARRRAA